MTDPVLSVRDLVVTYGDRPVLDGVDLDVCRGDVLGVVGESGGGKTTLARALAGAVDAPGRVAGSVTFRPAAGDPVDVLSLDGGALRRFRRRGVAVVSGGLSGAVAPDETGRDRVETALVDGDADAGRDRARRALRALGRDPERVLDARLRDASDGVARAALIAAAVAPGPAVLLLDSPPARFEPLARRLDAGAFAEDFGLALVLVGTPAHAVAALAERLAVLYGGRVVETGPTADLLDGADHPFARRLFDRLGG